MGSYFFARSNSLSQKTKETRHDKTKDKMVTEGVIIHMDPGFACGAGPHGAGGFPARAGGRFSEKGKKEKA
jgi:hypothetical protein